MELLRNPVVQTAVLPLIIAAVAAGLLRRRAAAAVPLAWFVAWAIILGLPAWPPLSATHKLAYAAAAGFAAAAFGRWWLAALVLAAGQVWLGWPRLGAMGLHLAATAAAGAFVMWRLGRQDGIGGGVMVLLAAAGMAAIALIGGAASLAQLAGALAAAMGGLLLWNWPRQRFAVTAAVLGAGVVIGLLAAQMALFTRASSPALALLLPVFVADLIPCRRPWAKPVVLALAALAPVAAAVWVANAQGGGMYTG